MLYRASGPNVGFKAKLGAQLKCLPPAVGFLVCAAAAANCSDCATSLDSLVAPNRFVGSAQHAWCENDGRFDSCVSISSGKSGVVAMSAEPGNWEQHIWCLSIGRHEGLKEQAFSRNPAGMITRLDKAAELDAAEERLVLGWEPRGMYFNGKIPVSTTKILLCRSTSKKTFSKTKMD